jgi:Cu/Ag efflux pump CusA
MEMFDALTGEFIDTKISALDKTDWVELPRDETAQAEVVKKLQDKVTEITAVAKVVEEPVEEPIEEIKP